MWNNSVTFCVSQPLMFHVLQIKELFIKHSSPSPSLLGMKDQCATRPPASGVSESHLHTFGRITWTGDQPIARPLTTEDEKETHKKKHTSIYAQS
jgi:hypothetical protein